MTDPVRFNDTLTLRVQPALVAAIDQAARARGQKASEWTRNAVRTALALDGISTEAPTQYALVSGDRILTTWIGAKPDITDVDFHPAGYAPADGGRWLPIENEDSEPFNSKLHWRLAPTYRVEADRVVRTYPVVLKGWEHA
jgi:hypothetical protein